MDVEVHRTVVAHPSHGKNVKNRRNFSPVSILKKNNDLVNSFLITPNQC